MASSIPTTEPTVLRAGDTWRWRRDDLSAYPASVWTLRYFFRSASAHFDVVASADGEAFVVALPRADTQALAAGAYEWVAVVESAVDRFQVGAGRMEIAPDLSVQQAHDARSFARKMLDYIEAELVSRGSSGQLDLINATLEQRTIGRDRAGLITLRSQFLAEVRREEAAQKGLSRNRLLVRFSAV